MKCSKCNKEAKSIEKGKRFSSWYCGPCNIFFWDKDGAYLHLEPTKTFHTTEELFADLDGTKGG